MCEPITAGMSMASLSTFGTMGAEMPSILIESAFITNEMEESRLRDKTYQDNIATAITAGIQSYIQQMRTFASVGEYQ